MKGRHPTVTLMSTHSSTTSTATPYPAAFNRRLVHFPAISSTSVGQLSFQPSQTAPLQTSSPGQAHPPSTFKATTRPKKGQPAQIFLAAGRKLLRRARTPVNRKAPQTSPPRPARALPPVSTLGYILSVQS